MCEAVNKLQTNLVCIVKGHHRSLLIKSARYQIFCNEGTDKEPTLRSNLIQNITLITFDIQMHQKSYAQKI